MRKEFEKKWIYIYTHIHNIESLYCTPKTNIANQLYSNIKQKLNLTICKTDSLQEFEVWLRELKEGLCINLAGWDTEGNGRGAQEGGDVWGLILQESCLSATPAYSPQFALTSNLKQQKRDKSPRNKLWEQPQPHSSILSDSQVTCIEIQFQVSPVPSSVNASSWNLFLQVVTLPKCKPQVPGFILVSWWENSYQMTLISCWV